MLTILFGLTGMATLNEQLLEFQYIIPRVTPCSFRIRDLFCIVTEMTFVKLWTNPGVRCMKRVS